MDVPASYNFLHSFKGARLRHANAGPQPGYSAGERELAERESVD